MRMMMAGKAAECFRDYVASVGGNSEIRHLITKFFRVDPETVNRWFRGSKFPLGGNLVAMWQLLYFVGYRVTELEGLSPILRDLSRLIAFHVVRAEVVEEACGFSHDQFLRVITGRGGTSSKNEAIIRRLVEDYRSRLELQMADFTGLHLEEGGAVGDNRKIAAKFISHVRAILPLVKIISSDKFSPAERFALHENVGGEGIYCLATILSSLCSETARRDIQGAVAQNTKIKTRRRVGL